MPRILLNPAFEDASGSFNGYVVGDGRSGLVLRRKPTYRRPTSPAQALAAARMAEASRVWNELTPAQFLAWRDYGEAQTRRSRLDGRPYSMTAQTAFIALATKFLQASPDGEVPHWPPQAVFLGDSVQFSVGPLGLSGGGEEAGLTPWQAARLALPAPQGPALLPARPDLQVAAGRAEGRPQAGWLDARDATPAARPRGRREGLAPSMEEDRPGTVPHGGAAAGRHRTASGARRAAGNDREAVLCLRLAEVGVIFTASRPNLEGVLTELLLERLESPRRKPKNRFVSAGFVAFRPDALEAFVPTGPGWFHCATRFVDPTTGQSDAWMPWGIVTVE